MRDAVFYTPIYKAEVRDEHESQLVSSFKGENKQYLSFYSKLSFFIYFHIIVYLVKHTRIKVRGTNYII